MSNIEKKTVEMGNRNPESAVHQDQAESASKTKWWHRVNRRWTSLRAGHRSLANPNGQ